MKVDFIARIDEKSSVETSNVALTQLQIDLVAEAIDVAASEHARFLEDDARQAFARLLRVMGKQQDASSIEPE